MPGTPLVTDEAGAWFALLSGGSTLLQGFHEEGPGLGKGLQINYPLPPQAGPEKGWNERQEVSSQMWRRGQAWG